MRAAFTDLPGVRHPIAGFNRSPGMAVNEAGQRIGAAADAGHEGALKLESFFVGQVVGSFSRLRPAAGITRQIVDDCEARLAELAALLPSGAPAAP